MEASTLQPPATLAHPRIVFGAPLLRLRSDEQLVALFRAGHDEAFRAIHDRYHKRLFAYARQMLPGRQDAEDALQDVFVRAYAGLRASDRDLALRAWLFRVAHNRCVDELRKPSPPSPEVLQLVRTNSNDPLAEIDLRESLRRLVEDIRRLPEQQRSALLMRELAGMSYAELASSLGITVGAVKSLLVRARLGLAQAATARDTACALIREQLVEAHDRGIRPTANTRKHVRDCPGCKGFRRELRGVSRQLAATAPAMGPLGVLAKVLGISGGGGAAGGAGGSAALLGGSGTTASAGGLALSTGHVATLLVAAVATAGGAVELQHTILPVAKLAAPVRAQPSIRHQPLAAPTAPASAPAVQTSAGNASPAITADPRPALTSTASSSSTVATHSPTSDAAADSAARSPAGTAVGKRHTQTGTSSTTTTGTATVGPSASGTCTAAATTTSPTTGSSAPASAAGSAPTGSPSSGATSTTTSPPANGSCTAASGSSTTTSGASSASSTSGTSSATGTATSTSGASPSSSSAAGSAGPSTSSSPQSSSSVGTG